MIVSAVVAATTLCAALAPGTWAQEPSPRDIVRLADSGYGDTVLRGRFVSADFSVPGPGDYELAPSGTTLELVYDTSALLATSSALTLVWNGVPIGDRLVNGDAALERWTVPVPTDRILPSVNRLQVQGTLQPVDDQCGTAEQALHLTVFRGTVVRYQLASRQPQPAPVTPDLGRYPWPFFEPEPAGPADVVFVLPADASRAELGAAAGVSAQLGQFAGVRQLVIRAAVEQNPLPPQLASANLVYVGKIASLPSLSATANLPLTITPDGTFAPPDGPPAEPDTGVILELQSPLNPARMALAVTGTTDAAVAKAGRVLSGRLGPRLLGGAYVFVADVVPGSGTPPETASGAISLASLGRSDETVAGVGDQSLSFKLDVAGTLPSRSGLPLDVVVSHSPLLDMDRSSMRVVLNGVPITATLFKDLPAARATVRVDLPASAVRPGQNTVEVQFSLHPPPLAYRRDCGRIPVEQAWAVLHADTSYRLPEALSAASDVSLASYPFPFLDQSGMDQTTYVVPPGVESLGPFLQLVADAGRSARGQWLTPAVIPTTSFQPAGLNANVVLWGTPAENPVIGQIGNSLPIAVDEGQRTRFVFSDDLRLSVRDDVELGIVQLLPSPWARGRYVLVVSGTQPTALPLSVRALNQSGLSGNVALARPGLPPTITAIADIAPPPRNPLQVSSYTLRPPGAGPVAARRGGPPPLAMVLAGAAALVSLMAALVLAYQAFIVQPRRRR